MLIYHRTVENAISTKGFRTTTLLFCHLVPAKRRIRKLKVPHTEHFNERVDFGLLAYISRVKDKILITLLLNYYSTVRLFYFVWSKEHAKLDSNTL